MKIACLKGGLLLCSFFLSMTIWSQTKQVSGKILSANDNLPMAGVSVTVKGKSGGTQTNEAGIFTIDAAASDVLVISYTGFTTQEINVGNSSNLNITLQ